MGGMGEHIISILSGNAHSSDSKGQAILGNGANTAESIAIACSKMLFMSKSLFEDIKADGASALGCILSWVRSSASVAGKSMVKDICFVPFLMERIL
eukprot:scaffold1395_cov152-Amphora_coffeaeformis.AAC.13